jgi:predicted DNA-binding transcriptional regulator YafY
MGAASSSAKEQVEHARQRIHVDLAGWASTVDESSLPLLQRAIWEDRLISIRYRASRSSFEIAPLGLVSKGGQWYLVALSKDRYRTYNVSRMHDITVLPKQFVRPVDFDLATHWEEAATAYPQTFNSFIAKLRVRGDALARIRWTYARSKTLSEPDEDGWVDAVLDLEQEDYALGTIRSLGNELIVRSPAKLRRLAVADARAFLAANPK